MELCDEYIHEMIQLDPEMNDFHQLPEYKHLRANYTNTLTKEFQKKERELIKKYYKLVKQKQEKSFYDLVFYDDLKIMIKESKYISLDHIPIDSLNNYPISYVSGIQGETDYEFTDKKSYLDYLPEKHTDFIFTLFSEEFGFFGSVFILFLYGVIISRIVKIGNITRSNFGKLYCYSFATAFFIYVVVNMGMVLGLLPIVGSPLPIMSYGGSSMMAIMLGLGIVMSCKVYKDTPVN